MALVVLKCGGAVAGQAAQVIHRFAKRSDVVVVHGAGPQISAEMERRGLEVRFVNGRRYTTAAALEVVRESLAEVNEALCAAIGPRAAGFMGDEIGLEATQVSKLGLVGDPLASRPALVHRLQQAGWSGTQEGDFSQAGLHGYSVSLKDRGSSLRRNEGRCLGLRPGGVGGGRNHGL